MKPRTLVARTLLALILPMAVCLAHAGAPLELIGYKTRVPDGWKQQPPENSMRLAQFEVPGAAGKEAGQALVFYFGQGGGGTVDANIQRWKSNFVGPGGKPVRALRRQGKIGALPVTWAEMHGAYARGVGMGIAGEAKPNQTLLVAIVETPKGNLTFQLFGPRESVAAQRKAFEAMVKGLQ